VRKGAGVEKQRKERERETRRPGRKGGGYRLEWRHLKFIIE
jgi:hypothetical protein